MEIWSILCPLLFLILTNCVTTAVYNNLPDTDVDKTFLRIKRNTNKMLLLNTAQDQTVQTSLINNNTLNISSVTTSTETILTNKPLLGVNGTGQRKAFTKPDVDIDHKLLSDVKDSNFQKENNTSSVITEPSNLDILENVDVSDNTTIDIIKKHNYTINLTEEHHSYYNSTMLLDADLIQKYWALFKNLVSNGILSTSHRRAMTVKLSFDFPFYGSLIRNITVATGGFIYTGDHGHYWLAATQYIAPLMANFDTSISNSSFVRYDDNGTAFTAVWENVYLQDLKHIIDGFTFSATLHNTGDIVFAYFKIPVEITTISDDKHPVKVGLSDAYVTDESEVKLSRRKTIYEYHRVNFHGKKIQSSTLIYLKSLPTCLSFSDCESCTNNDLKFECFWCPLHKICSTGTDRKTQNWNKNCASGKIKKQQNCPDFVSKINKSANNLSSVIYNNYTNDISTQQPKIEHDGGNFNIEVEKYSKSSNEGVNSSNFGLTLGVFIPIGIVTTLLVWILYAYRNPHSKSGQLLIQYRPSQWSWRRGEARYTAATIHM